MNSAVAKTKAQIHSFWGKLSGQEKLLILIMTVVAAVMGISPLFDAADEVFTSQRQKLETAKKNVAATPKKIVEYLALEKRRDSVRERYKSVELKQGVRSHIESLIKTHVGADTSPTIQNLNIKKIGEGYVQEPFKVGFKTNNFKTLTKFLEQLVEGPQPLVLTRLVIKRVRDDRLEVSLDTSSIRKE